MLSVSDLFNVRYGHSLELVRLKTSDQEQGIAFVSRKMNDNGVSAFVERVDSIEPARAGELSVALSGNGVLSAFLQERPFYTGYHVAILSPKQQLARNSLLYYCMCITANRYRYSYGRQANRTLGTIHVPSPEDLPEWVERTDVDCFIGAERTASAQSVELTDPPSWSTFELSDLFYIRKGKRLTKARMIDGQTPFIGAVDNSNGLTAFVGQAAIHSGNTITVNYNGNGVAEAFYQPIPFWCSDDVNVLYPKFSLTPERALFICTVVRLERYRFSYGRKWHLDRMKAASIRLPSKSDGTPDWCFMDGYIRALPFSSQINDDAATDLSCSLQQMP
jgi:hypothetical protein